MIRIAAIPLYRFRHRAMRLRAMVRDIRGRYGTGIGEARPPPGPVTKNGFQITLLGLFDDHDVHAPGSEYERQRQILRSHVRGGWISPHVVLGLVVDRLAVGLDA